MREIDYNALLVDITDSVGLVADAETYELLFMNKVAQRTYGFSDEKGYLGKCCYEVLHGLSEPCSNCPIGKIKVGEMYRWEQYNQRVGRWHDNSDHFVEWEGRKLYVKIARDITARKEDRLSSPEQLMMEDVLFHCLQVVAEEDNFNVALQKFLESVACYYNADRAYIFEFDLEAQVLNNTYEWCAENVSPEMGNLQNVPLSIVKHWVRKFDSEGEFFIRAIDQEIMPGTEEYNILTAQGIISLMASPLRQEDAEIIGFLGVDNPRRQVGNKQLLRSVTDFIRTEMKKRKLHYELEHLCYTDGLTGVYNRQEFERYIKKYALKTPASLGTVVVSINGMKEINTQYGTTYGDTVIRSTCKTMQEQVPGKAFRISGDEFITLSEDVSKDDFQAAVSNLRRKFQSNEGELVSIGCAWQGGEISPDELIQQAEELMGAEKRSYYGKLLKGDHTHTRLGLAEEVLREIEEERFVAYFQPQIDFAQGSIIGAEALVRKLGEDGNLIFPDKFIPFYEAAGVIRYVDLHVLDLACAALRKWDDEGISLRVSVNFSRLTLMEPEIVDELLAVCRKHEVSPERITVEVTENINKMEPAHLKNLIKQLKEKEFHISLDDFGSSYSNLAILSSIEFDEVKFDRTLIQNLESNKKSQVVVRNGMKMCEELEGSISVAEGIETKEQMELLIRFGCYIGQGYYFSRPISQTAFSELLKRWSTYRPRQD